jgi:hypothetical protein
MHGIAVIGVEKYKNFLGEYTLRPPRPPTIKCDTTPNILLPTNHLSFLHTRYSMVPWSLFVDAPTDEFLKNALIFFGLPKNHLTLCRSGVNPLSDNAPRCALLYYIMLSNARWFYLSGPESAAAQWVNQTICPCTVALHPDAPYFIRLLCLMPDDFTCQGESAATQWVNNCVNPSWYKRFMIILQS